MNQAELIDELAEAAGLSAAELDEYWQLDNEQLQHLIEALQTAQRRQSQALEAAIDQAMDHIPALLRKPILKILGRRRT